MKITFWGTRGSIPSPGKDTVTYGGNTACVGVELKSKQIVILDAGTGIRKLGIKLAKSGKPLKLYFLFSHSHWDHIQGIPFFLPLYNKANELFILNNAQIKKSILQIFKDMLKHPYFPLDFENIPAKVFFFEAPHHSLKLAGASVDFIKVNHPDTAHAYRFREGGRSFVYMTDNEIRFPQYDHQAFDKLCSFCQGTDLLIHDAQYTKEEYARKTGWGHSTYEAAVHLALTAQVKQLAFFHHEPEYPDRVITAQVAACVSQLKRARQKLRCFAAREGMTISLA